MDVAPASDLPPLASLGTLVRETLCTVGHTVIGLAERRIWLRR